jgi:hypothetical protein
MEKPSVAELVLVVGVAAGGAGIAVYLVWGTAGDMRDEVALCGVVLALVGAVLVAAAYLIRRIF